VNLEGLLTKLLLCSSVEGANPSEASVKGLPCLLAFLDSYTLFLLIVMVCAGAVGGLAGYFLGNKANRGDGLSLIASAIVGVTASLVVPLVLNMVSSDTLSKGEKDPSSLLVFIGICVLAALFAVRLSYRRPETGMEQISSVKEAIARIETDLCEPDLSELKGAEMETIQGDLKPDDYRVLEGLAQGRFIFRSISGLAADTGLGRDLLARRLPLLARQGLLRRRLTEDGNIRWALSPKGRLAVNQWLLLRPNNGER
jgi:hypothetical protein